MTNAKTRKLVFTAMFAVINYVAFTYGKITIPVTAGTSTAIHIANAVVVLSAWFLGPIYGGLSGAVGLSIADVFDPRYITSAPKTFLLKFLIGFIAGTLANRFRLREKEERKEIISITAISAAAALGFNVVADPIVGYFYRKYLLGIPQEAAKIIATWVAGSTAINAVVCTIISVILYLALYKSFLPRLPKE
ncbi:MAG: ECF transporter S component [Erysipelotrichaceae bacterium]|nr:ECF transporter S component [Erysipelotrichaceae bacterium]MBQ1347725.1 ECF transporter S component [Erysipelotrichaceae bacterium]MBQ1812103.1 ECF transporter S component [Erysipelotrichaceae bacterium]MBQ2231930.1 ECF transporter S component [Erysipelotrichaceae bacterium]MBQ2505979.1 ECF transporter S component [Erysipelotrichaceae bacterium]